MVDDEVERRPADDVVRVVSRDDVYIDDRRVDLIASSRTPYVLERSRRENLRKRLEAPRSKPLLEARLKVVLACPEVTELLERRDGVEVLDLRRSIRLEPNVLGVLRDQQVVIGLLERPCLFARFGRGKGNRHLSSVLGGHGDASAGRDGSRSSCLFGLRCGYPRDTWRATVLIVGQEALLPRAAGPVEPQHLVERRTGGDPLAFELPRQLTAPSWVQDVERRTQRPLQELPPLVQDALYSVTEPIEIDRRLVVLHDDPLPLTEMIEDDFQRSADGHSVLSHIGIHQNDVLIDVVDADA